MLKDKPFVVIDDYFSPTEYALIKRRVETSELTFVPHVSGVSTESKDILHDSGFASQWYCPEDKRNEYPFITELLHTKINQDFDVKNLMRIRLGVFIPSGSDLQVHDPHIDSRIPHYTGLLYTCTEVGAGHTHLWNEFYDPYLYTSIEENIAELGDKLSLDKAIKVEPKENRIIFFRGNMFHASSKPKGILRRTAININFEGVPRHGST